MKKSKRVICMLIAAVMLLGAFPAHAASAPPAATYKAASSTRLPDGTTGATVGATGVTQLDQSSVRCNPMDFDNCRKLGREYVIYGVKTYVRDTDEIKKYGWLCDPFYGSADHYRKAYVYAQLNSARTCFADFAGAKIPAGYLVDIYSEGKFICQYDTRGETQDFVIPCAPGDDPANPKLKTVPVVRTQFNDIKPGSRYYDAVTTLAKNKVIYTVFDEDPNGNFKPNARLTENEIRQIVKRLRGVATENYTWTRGEPQKLYCKAQYWRDDFNNPKWHVDCNHKV